MILKEADSRESDIKTLTALAASTSDHFKRKRIERELSNIKAGLSGERSAAHFLNRDFDGGNIVGIVHDIRLHAGNGDYAQIDHIIIHRIQGTAWVLETKNYSGRLTCDEWGDWSAWYGRFRKPIESPVEQARRHAVTLEEWFRTQGIEGIKKFVPVVLMSPSSNFSRKHIPNGAIVLKSDQFHRWWTKEADKIGVVKAIGMLSRFAVMGMSDEDMRGLGRRLRRAHTPASYDWHARFAGKDEYVEENGHEPNIVSGQKPRQASTIPTNLINTTTIPTEFQTRLGQVRIASLQGEDVAIRHAPDPALSQAVEKACRGRGRWNPRYRNWIVGKAVLPEILAELTTA